MFLPDVNLWLALAFEAHIHHVSAKRWFEDAAENECSFCRITQQEFLRLATNPKALGADAASLSATWRLYDAFRGDPRVAYAEEPVNLETLWRSHTQGQIFSPKVWNDAFLAAFAQAEAFELVTFDKGFARYKNLKHTIVS